MLQTKKIITSTLMFFLFTQTISLFGQKDDQCGSIPGETYLNYLTSTLAERERVVNQYYQSRSSGTLDDFNIPLQFHLTRTDAGEDQAVSDAVLDLVLHNLNAAYAPMRITFMTCENTKFIDNTNLHTNFDKDNDDSKLDQYDDKFVLNFYIVGNLADGLNGYANFPDNQIDRVVVEEDNALTTTVIHEVGHYFSLLHTYSTSRGNELVDGSNCLISGDFICDTPPDPGERNFFSDCIYTGTETDAAGTPYNPDGFNYMGKGQNTCRNRFSELQQNRILASLMMDRYYLVDCSLGEPAITCTNTIESFPYKESFEDYTGGTDWRQDFNDDFGWEWSTSTPSSSTGPTEAFDGNYFMFTEASDYQNATGIIISPCFNLQNQSEARMSFSYHMFGVDMGKLELQVSQNEGASWIAIWVQEGNKGNQWNSAQVSLNRFLGGTLQLRFSARTGSGSKGDMAVDKIVVSSTSSTIVTNIEEDMPVKNRLIVYPNPTKETLTIRYSNIEQIQPGLLITSIDGRTMYTDLSCDFGRSGECSLDISQLGAGTYLVSLIGPSKTLTATFIRRP